ncbi:hypothetical protein [Bacillus sp. AK031]
MYTSSRIQRKMIKYAHVFKALGIINEEELKKISVTKRIEKL